MSLELIKEITLDLENLTNSPHFTIKSGNNLSNIILVTLKKNSEIIQLSGLTVRYCFSRPDGTQNLSDAVVENNKVKIILTENDLISSGTASCEIISSENETILFSSTFYIKILPNVLDEQRIKSSDDYSSITTILEKANSTLSELSDLEEEISNNEALRITKESIRIENENVRQQNELKRENSFLEIERKTNQMINDGIAQTEQAKLQAEYAKKQGDYAKEQADKIVDTSIPEIISDIEELKGYVGYVDNDIYGVEVDFKNNIFTRLSGATHLKEGDDFNNINAYNRRRCILDDSGNVLSYFGDDEYIEDGSKGQVMVEQPKFYYKVVPLELEQKENGTGYNIRKARYYICDTPKQGFNIHPAFVHNEIEKDKIYLSAYEGSIYDVSSSAYLLDNEQVADFATDKLCSITNAKPCSGTKQKLTISNARKIANNRGSGFGLSTIYSISVTQLLFLIEYASFNMQQKLGTGVVNKSDTEKTGGTSNLGNKTGNSQNSSVSYRGEENFYGNINVFLDGINIYNYNKGDVYISNHDFKEGSVKDPYKNINISLPENGYISSFGYSKDFDFLFIPSESKGNSTVPVGDSLTSYNSANFVTIVGFGGRWTNSNIAGGFYYITNSVSSSSNAYLGCRLLYIPQK